MPKSSRDIALDPDTVEAWLVDGFNALHACLLKGTERRAWWRAEAQARVAEWLEPFARERRVLLVFDAARADSERCSNEGFSATLCFAPDADAEIVASVRRSASTQVCVVTADRSLADRCRALGASVLRPWAFEALFLRSASHALTEP